MHQWETARDGTLIARDGFGDDGAIALIPSRYKGMWKTIRFQSNIWLESAVNGLIEEDPENAAMELADTLLGMRDYLRQPPTIMVKTAWKHCGDGEDGEPAYIRQYRHCAAYVARAPHKPSAWFSFDGTTVSGFFATADQAMRDCDVKHKKEPLV